MVATDNHASRFRIQQLAFKYYVPFITAGVNITVDDGKIIDMSGEVILIRMGDKVCLTCLKRLKYNEIAKEIHPDKNVRNGLVRKGYVQGLDVKEPAVKTFSRRAVRRYALCSASGVSRRKERSRENRISASTP